MQSEAAHLGSMIVRLFVQSYLGSVKGIAACPMKGQAVLMNEWKFKEPQSSMDDGRMTSVDLFLWLFCS